jgi:hypothetical protein
MAVDNIENSVEHINLIHPDLQSLINKGAKVKETLFYSPSHSVQQSVDMALQVIPEAHRPDLKRLPQPKLRISSITKDVETLTDPEGEGDQILFYVPGAEGTAASAAHIMAKLLEKSPAKMGVTISSYASIDNLDSSKDRYVKDPFEKATHYLAVILEVIKQNPSKKIILEGTSMGALDMIATSILLKKLIAEGKVNTEIAGVILNQPAGMYDQSRVEFATKRKDEHVSNVKEREYLFPSYQEFAEVETELELAKEQGDIPKTLGLQEQLKLMTQKKQNPPHLNNEQAEQLHEIDTKISQVLGQDDKELARLEKQRDALLIPVIQESVMGAETRRRGVSNLVWAKDLARIHVFFPQNALSWVRCLDPELRSQIDFPLAVVMGERDAYFKDSELQTAMKKDRIETVKRLQGEYDNLTADQAHEVAEYFPRAPKVLFAHIANWSHNSALLDPQKNAEIKLDLYRRLEEPTQERFINLQYVA